MVAQMWLQFRMGRALLALIKDPNRTEKVFEIGNLALSSKDTRPYRAVEEYALAQPAFRRDWEERHLPADFDLVTLARLPEGTLGREYARHMRKNGLSVDFYSPVEASSPIRYLAQRMRQVHDVWHVLTGYDITVGGGFALQAFTLAQIRSGLQASIIAAGLLHTVRKAPESIFEVMGLVAEGYQRGRTANYLPGIRWHELWELPLEEARLRAGVQRVAGAA